MIINLLRLIPIEYIILISLYYDKLIIRMDLFQVLQCMLLGPLYFFFSNLKLSILIK